ncbi:MAG: glutamate-cysteine ligase family protein [Rubrobacteraceae bacterium]
MELHIFEDRRIGMEQEFFLVDEAGFPSNRADEFLARCWELAEAADQDPGAFAPECARNLLEVSTAPAYSVDELAVDYLGNLQLALEAGRDLGLRLYPLATYPLSFTPDLREEQHYELQSLTMGPERFLHAGRCAGVHLHVEVAPDTVDPQVGVSYDSTPRARKELLDTYNLVTALDAAIIALTRSSSLYGGAIHEVTTRTAYYRGSPDFAPYGLYAGLQTAGGLHPYATSVQELVALQFERYHAWLSAMDRAGVDPRLFRETGSGLLDASWNPVRINAQGTIELRGIDSNYPDVNLDVARLVRRAVGRVREEGLAVTPAAGATTFELDGDLLFVPDFEYLGTELFRAAATEGLESPEVLAYLDSIVGFVGEDVGLESLWYGGRYHNTEMEVLEGIGSSDGTLSTEEGLKLVREACDVLEGQVAAVYREEGVETTKAGADGD